MCPATATPPEDDLELRQRVDAVRRFNRFYTRQIGVLPQGHLHSRYSLAEVRVLYELAHRERPSASELGRALGLDAGYLSRILGRFVAARLVTRTRAAGDARRSLVTLTARGREVFRELDGRAQAEVAQLLGGLPAGAQARLVAALGTVEQLLGGAPAAAAAAAPIVLRAPRAGELGWVVARHGAVYAEEYGWDATFEALVAEIVAGFGKKHDPAREAAWIAERAGEPVGSIFLVQQSRTVAKLRLLLVEPRARGAGLGHALVAECIAFARRAGYRTLTLWTNDVLVAARRVYEAAGFVRVAREPQRLFGKELVSETWELALHPG
jgi:DNA-binding MarR family transcriptional regulator/GNAT superfamily N-acetyltransferase